MATAAALSKGTTIAIKDGTGPRVKASELIDVSGIFSGSPAMIEATHLDSAAKEKLVGTTDEGSIKLTFNYVPNDAGQAAIIARRQTSTIGDFAISLGATGKTLTFFAWVMSSEITLGVDKKFELNVTLEVSGAVTLA